MICMIRWSSCRQCFLELVTMGETNPCGFLQNKVRDDVPWVCWTKCFSLLFIHCKCSLPLWWVHTYTYKVLCVPTALGWMVSYTHQLIFIVSYQTLWSHSEYIKHSIIFYHSHYYLDVDYSYWYLKFLWTLVSKMATSSIKWRN